jgi:hypothetical protein
MSDKQVTVTLSAYTWHKLLSALERLSSIRFGNDDDIVPKLYEQIAKQLNGEDAESQAKSG